MLKQILRIIVSVRILLLLSYQSIGVFAIVVFPLLVFAIVALTVILVVDGQVVVLVVVITFLVSFYLKWSINEDS